MPNAMAQDPVEEDPHGVNARLKHLLEAPLPHVTHRAHLIVPGAARGVVHLPNIHQGDATTEELKRQVEQSQREVAELIEALCRDERVRLTIIFNEGVLARGEPPPNLPRSFSVSRQLRLSDRALMGAAAYAAERGLVEERGAEKTETFTAAWNRKNDANWNKVVLEDREDAFLRIASAEDSGSVCYVAYGEAHDWNNNVAIWNREHPREKFSLVTLCTRESHTKYVRLGILPPPDPTVEDAPR
jgi:hypothetical protein